MPQNRKDTGIDFSPYSLSKSTDPAAAAEELSNSIEGIARQVSTSARIAGGAVEEIRRSEQCSRQPRKPLMP